MIEVSSCFSASRFSQMRLMAFAANAQMTKNKMTAPIQTNANFHMTDILIRYVFEWAKIEKNVVCTMLPIGLFQIILFQIDLFQMILFYRPILRLFSRNPWFR